MKRYVLLNDFLRHLKEASFSFGCEGQGNQHGYRHIFLQRCGIDLLQPDVVRQYSAYSSRAVRRNVLASQAKQIIIDEIQHVPELLNVVHRPH